MALSAQDFKTALRQFAAPTQAKTAAWFFKTGPGEYGEGDQFIGVKVPQIRAVCRQFKNLPLKEEGWEAFGIKGKYNRETHILIRKIIDGLSAVAYLLKGKFSYAKAVTRAHKDFRQMKKSMEPSPRIKEQNLTGIYKGSIIKIKIKKLPHF